MTFIFGYLQDIPGSCYQEKCCVAGLLCFICVRGALTYSCGHVTNGTNPGSVPSHVLSCNSQVPSAAACGMSVRRCNTEVGRSSLGRSPRSLAPAVF